MKKNFIKFSEVGTNFMIYFVNGKESIEIDSKEEGFEAIVKLAKEKKITPEEFSEMSDQILSAEKLQWSESSGLPISFGGEILGRILTLIAMHSLDDIIANPENPIKIAYFDVCKSCKKHGRIYAKKCYTGRLDSKKEAHFYLLELKKKEDITEEEFLKVKAEIDASPIPEE